MIKNWLGLEPHPVDDLVHWSSKDPHSELESFKKDYELIAGLGPEYKSALERLLQARHDASLTEAAETHDPDF